MYTQAKKLNIYISNTDKFKHRPLHEVIVYAAKRYGMQGASAFKGYMGFGLSSQVTNMRFWEIAEKIPVTVQIIDTPEKIESFMQIVLPYFDKIKNGCLITLDSTEIILVREGKKKR
jgi:PII-like signaling protein